MSDEISFPLEREAARGDPMPDNLKLHDQAAYVALRSLYYDYKEKRITRDSASKEKRKIISAWEKAERESEYAKNTAYYYAMLNKDTEAARTAVRKNPTPENAIRLVRVMDGLEKMTCQSDGTQQTE